jgi:hypothetical protein
MDIERREKRAEARLAVETVRQLLDMGVVPRTVTIGDVTIDVASYAAPQQPTASESVGESAIRHRGHLDRLADRIASRRTAGVSA